MNSLLNTYSQANLNYPPWLALLQLTVFILVPKDRLSPCLLSLVFSTDFSLPLTATSWDSLPFYKPHPRLTANTEFNSDSFHLVWVSCPGEREVVLLLCPTYRWANLRCGLRGAHGHPSSMLKPPGILHPELCTLPIHKLPCGSTRTSWINFSFFLFNLIFIYLGFPGGSDWRICLQCGGPVLDFWVGKIPLQWQPTPVFLPGQSHGERSPAGYSLWGQKQSDTTEWLTHIHTHIRVYLAELGLSFGSWDLCCSIWTL